MFTASINISVLLKHLFRQRSHIFKVERAKQEPAFGTERRFTRRESGFRTVDEFVFLRLPDNSNSSQLFHNPPLYLYVVNGYHGWEYQIARR